MFYPGPNSVHPVQVPDDQSDEPEVASDGIRRAHIAWGWLAAIALCLAVTGTTAVWIVSRSHDPARASRPFRIGFQASPPFQYVEPDGSASGVAVDIVAEACRQRGIPFEWVHCPAGPDSSLTSGKADLWPLVTITPDRLAMYHITDPWVSNTPGVVSLERNGLRNHPDLTGRRIAYAANFRPSKLLMERWLHQSVLIPKNSPQEALAAMFAGEVDAAAILSGRANTADLREVLTAHLG